MLEESSMLDLDEFQSLNIVMDTTMKVEYIAALVAAKGGCLRDRKSVV